jgi:predicted nucleotidyltransferase
MALPEFDVEGDLPIGTHKVDRHELFARFGNRGPQRTHVSQRLARILDLAASLTDVERVIIFGSYVTAKEAPGDVDLLLIVSGDFQVEQTPTATRVLFDHQRAEAELGAHIFWLRNSLGRNLIEQFIDYYAINRYGKQRGVAELD